MSQQNPTIIVGHLDDSELTKSIDKLVSEVAKKTSGMAEDFTQAIDKMKFAMKDFAVTQKVSVDLMKEAWRDMSKSFDAMVAAQSAATGGGKGSGKGKVYAPDTVGALEQEIALEKEKRREMLLGSVELDKQNALLEKRKKLLSEETSSPYKKIERSFTKEFNAANTMSTKTLQQAEDKLKRLLRLQGQFKTAGLIDEVKMNRLQKAIDSVETKIERMRKKFGSQGTQPNTLQDVLGMDENSFDAITKKMASLKKLSWSDPIEQKHIIDEYQRLRQEQTKLMASNAQMTRSNNYLAQSFGYIRNRIVYALTLGALTNFVKQLYEIRGQYELLERSLGVLVGSFEKGTQIFNELNEMAIKSPFTLIELGTAAKQLTAYNFAANEVVDTTRRLADISAALGVPMERLTYNLGQIKAQGVLNARDARDFANAGLAIVPMLAKMYTEQKTFGDEMVTTAKVYDMMSKKMVTYSDVLKVLYRVTDEGGKFFDFQAKQADTLRVQMANLTLAYNNMLNEIGSENQGLLTAWVSGLKTLLKNWKGISRAILTLVTTLGTYKAVAAIVSALNSRMFVGSVLVGLRNYILGIKNATGAMATFNAVTRANPIAFLISALVAAIGYFALFNHKVKETTVEMERFGENASKQIKKVETLGKVLAGIEEGSSTYKRALSDLNQIVSEYGVTEIKNRNEINSKIQQTIQLIKEEGKERQYANNIAKGEERYLNATGDAKTSLNEGLSGLEWWFGTTSKVKKEILDNTEAITDIASSIIEENINLVVNKTGEEAYKGLLEIRNKVRSGLKNSGLSDNAINFILNKGYINAAIKDYRVATEEHERYNQKIKGYYDAATKATQSTMTFTEKVNANARALRNNTEDAISLYNRIYDIVKIAKENHTINFDLKLSAEKPPKWMLDKSLPELQRLAERFTAIAQSGGHAEGYNRESTYERGLMYASAARIKQEEEERKSRQKDKKTRTKQSDEIAKAIKNEISLVKELQGAYDTLTKKGDSHANAIAKVQDLYGKTINLLNKDMDKFGLPRLDLSIIKGNNHNEILAFFEKLRDVLESKGLSNLERMEAVEGVVKEFRLKADTYNLDMITKGLNNELGKLKDEYELAVELDANPEMGNMFTQMFGLDTTDFPRTIDEYMQRVQNEFDKARMNLNLGTSLNVFKANTEQWYDWGKAVGYSKEQVDDFKKSFDGSIAVAKKWAQDTVKQTQDLQYKLADNNGKIAIEEEKLAILRQRLAQETNEEQKRLLDLQIQDQENAIAKLKEEILQMLPTYQRLFGEIAEHSAWMTRKLARDYKNMLIEGKNRGLNADNTYSVRDPISGQITRISKERMGKEIKNADKELQKTQSTIKKITEAFTKGEDGVVDWVHGVELVGEELSKLSNLVDVVGQIADAFGNPDEYNATAEAIHDISSSISGIATAAQGIGQFASGDYIGGAASILSGVFTTVSAWMDNSDKKIQQSIKNSERAVKRLENAYKELENTATNSYGALTSGAKEATLANKELQLIELKRQLTLEQSRSSKKRDEDKIEDLKGQIIDLKNEINNASQEVINDLLGISSAGDGITALVEAMVDAFRNGEDAMDAFGKKWDEMIDNMILKLIVTKYMQDAWDELMSKLNIEKERRLKDSSQKVEKAKEEANKVAAMSDEDIATELAKQNKYIKKVTTNWMGKQITTNVYDLDRVSAEDIKAYRNAAESSLTSATESLNSASLDYTKWSIDYMTHEGRDYMTQFANTLKDGLGEFYTFGQDSDKQLSALQQGIQGITEDTAGALESYMNIVSQRMFEQGSLIKEIRDVVVGFDADVQTATQAQMLLQLQQSYAVQMAIQGILEGWNNPSGQAVRVELVS